jgi:glutamine synthetase
MKYTKEEVLQYAVEENVRFIRLAFCDVFGVQRNIAIMPSELERAFEYGIPIDASAIGSFGMTVKADLFLHPDPSTLAVLPWRPEHGRVVRMYCDITWPDGTPFACDARTFLRNAVDAAAKKGYSFRFGTESEFYLFRNDMEGVNTGIPYDDAGYMDIGPTDRCENIRREICITLEQMGIFAESSHHEEGPGQNEIDFRYCDALKSADDAMTFRSVVSAISNRNGATADFSPKPVAGRSGNGMHINFSVKKGKEDVSFEPVVAGILDHIQDITLFLNPDKRSYDRLGSDKAPEYISWARENRSALIRIPAASGEFVRAELRSPDPSSNPYLAFGLLIYAGLEGLEKGLVPPAPIDTNLYAAGDPEGKFKKLPSSLRDSAELAGASDFIKKYVPEEILSAYLKRAEQ